MQNIHDESDAGFSDLAGRDLNFHYEDEELDAMMLADQAEQADRAEARDADERAALAAAVPCESPGGADGHVAGMGELVARGNLAIMAAVIGTLTERRAS